MTIVEAPQLLQFNTRPVHSYSTESSTDPCFSCFVEDSLFFEAATEEEITEIRRAGKVFNLHYLNRDNSDTLTWTNIIVLGVTSKGIGVVGFLDKSGKTGYKKISNYRFNPVDNSASLS